MKFILVCFIVMLAGCGQCKQPTGRSYDIYQAGDILVIKIDGTRVIFDSYSTVSQELLWVYISTPGGYRCEPIKAFMVERVAE